MWEETVCSTTSSLVSSRSRQIDNNRVVNVSQCIFLHALNWCNRIGLKNLFFASLYRTMQHTVARCSNLWLRNKTPTNSVGHFPPPLKQNVQEVWPCLGSGGQRKGLPNGTGKCGAVFDVRTSFQAYQQNRWCPAYLAKVISRVFKVIPLFNRPQTHDSSNLQCARTQRICSVKVSS